MEKTVISVEHLSKHYDLGMIGTGTISRDLSRWWALLRGNPDPYQKIGQVDYGNRDGDSIWALNDINFQVEQGETLGIIGHNGAGKSTLLKILSRVTAPTSGVVKIKGRIGSLLEVGTGFHPELTGRENVYLNGTILGMRRDEVTRKFDEIVDFSGVEKYIDTPVKRYSSGMRVRLGFAVAAHLDPEILVIDEVLAVGDAEFQKKALGKMSDVAHEGRTVLFVSHNMYSITQLCKNAILLKKGRIKNTGNAYAVVDEYLKQISPIRSLKRDLNSYKRRSESVGKKAKITYVELVPENRNRIYFYGNFKVIMKIKIYEDIPDLELGIGFNNSRGLRLVTITSEELNLKRLKKGQELNISTNLFNFPLPPATYKLALGASSGGNLSIDSIPEVLTFEVDPDAENTKYSERPELGVRIKGKWQIN